MNWGGHPSRSLLSLRPIRGGEQRKGHRPYHTLREQRHRGGPSGERPSSCRVVTASALRSALPVERRECHAAARLPQCEARASSGHPSAAIYRSSISSAWLQLNCQQTSIMPVCSVWTRQPDTNTSSYLTSSRKYKQANAGRAGSLSAPNSHMDPKQSR